ncbi:MAG: GspE/PulE family protein [bacterium]
MSIGPSLEDLLPASTKKNESGGQLKEKIKQITLREKEEETEKNALALGLPYISLIGMGISPDTLTTIPEEESRALQIVCFLNNGTRILIGAIDPNDKIKDLANMLAEKHHAEVVTYLISKRSLEAALLIYKNLPKIRKNVKGIEIKSEDIEKFKNEIKSFRDLNEKIQKVSLTELVTIIVAGAIISRASDIHIEAEEADIKIRYRIDGVLNDAATIAKDTWSKVISRLKQLSGLKINISDRPQDGRFSIFLKDDRVDVRVSALPTAFGESVVIRLLMSSSSHLSFEELGLRGRAYDTLQKEILRPNGMIITTGPTGSGKTTSLYAVLTKLNTTDTKIITIEDPIEYELKGVNQSQVNPHYTFSQGLRSIVRQDPDVIMIGEIRDLETAEIAIQAALTGHLVLSTIHTNDAFGAVPRFLSLGAKPFLLAPALNVSIGQRLVRKICVDCKQEATVTEAEMLKAKTLLENLPPNSEYKDKIDINNLKFFKGAGCDSCQSIGYKGRIGIYEIMPITDIMKDTVTKGNLSEFDIKKMAHEEGVITMVQDGIIKALEGITSLDEIFRVAE